MSRVNFEPLRIEVTREFLRPTLTAQARLSGLGKERTRSRTGTDPQAPARRAPAQRTKSGRIFRDGAPQQCASHRGETRESLKSSDFAISTPVA